MEEELRIENHNEKEQIIVQEQGSVQEQVNIEEQVEKNKPEEELLRYFIRKGFLLDKNLAEFFQKIGNKELAEEILGRIVSVAKTRVITKALITIHFHEIKPFLNELELERREFFDSFFKPDEIKVGKEEEEVKEVIKGPELPSFKILSSKIIQDRKIEVRDFVTHFKNRYNFFKDLLKEKKELRNLTSIDKIGNNRDFSIIGMVYSKRITKNKNVLIELEDPTGRINVVVNQTKPELFEKTKEIMLDDIIAVRCSGSREIGFVNDFYFTDLMVNDKKKSKRDVYALFTSDIHLGSHNFLEENFEKFISWLNGEGVDEEQKEKISKIKYLFIVGDSVDGVGVFPGQEEALKIKDMKSQYIELAKYLERIPKHITIFMCPGQHDAVRVPEPQPPVDVDFAEPLTKLENLYLVTNPAVIELESGHVENAEGIKVLMYHGASLHSWINEIEELRMMNAHHCPAKVLKHILKHRHLSPTHSATTYVPDDKEDSLVIKQAPDIMLTGDLHKPDVDMYNNILIICSSCWQSITSFEEKVGNKPDPCKVPMLNLKTRELKILDFSGD
jgi:DNA polymerase II small subunit